MNENLNENLNKNLKIFIKILYLVDVTVLNVIYKLCLYVFSRMMAWGRVLPSLFKGEKIGN